MSTSAVASSEIASTGSQRCPATSSSSSTLSNGVNSAAVSAAMANMRLITTNAVVRSSRRQTVKRNARLVSAAARTVMT